MDVATQDQVLREVADGGSMNYNVWPTLLPFVIERVETISRTRFRIPNLPPPAPSYPLVIPNSQPDPSPQADKGNAEPTSSATIADPLDPSSDPHSQTQVPACPSIPAEPPSSTMGESGPDLLPPQITGMLDEIVKTINDTFPIYPPHTMQRLAELVLEPTRHYKHLVPYLHALDRVVHVTSGANVYPLPPAIPDMSALQFLTLSAANGNGNGDESNSAALAATAAVASVSWANPTSTAPTDEAQLGGALLTPIPWLARQAEEAAAAAAAAGVATPGTPASQGGEFRTESTETIDGPNGMGSIETVSINLNGIASPVMPTGTGNRGVTQGELLRQEQRAGVVPKTQLDKANGEDMEGVDVDVEIDDASADDAPGMGEKDPDRPENGNLTQPAAETEGDEIPHARGPAEIGDADLGPQKGMVGVEMHGIDVEAAVGRKAVGSTPIAAFAVNVQRKAADDEDEDSDDDDEDDEDDEDDDDDDAASKALSPKREAGDELEGLSPKRTKTGDNDDNAAHKSTRKDAEGDRKIDDVGATTTTTEPSDPLAYKRDGEKADTENKEETQNKSGKGNEQDEMDVDKPTLSAEPGVENSKLGEEAEKKGTDDGKAA